VLPVNARANAAVVALVRVICCLRCNAAPSVRH
jgi:hypothetical protein